MLRFFSGVAWHCLPETIDESIGSMAWMLADVNGSVSCGNKSLFLGIFGVLGWVKMRIMGGMGSQEKGGVTAELNYSRRGKLQRLRHPPSPDAAFSWGLLHSFLG